MMKVLKWVGGIIVVVFVVGLIWGPKDGDQKNGDTDGKSAAAIAPSVVTPAVTVSIAERNEFVDYLSAHKPEVAENFTSAHRNAIRSARQYLEFQGYSRRGLIQQLSSDAGEGYRVADATVAVDSLNVDWNHQAENSARQYLDMQGYSCKGLIPQLSSSAGEGFTKSQAQYGAKQAGAC